MSEALQLDWDGWFKLLEESGIPEVVTTLDDLSETNDCITRVMKTDAITWSPEAYQVLHDAQYIVRGMRRRILAIPMKEKS